VWRGIILPIYAGVEHPVRLFVRLFDEKVIPNPAGEK
jgi:hypothetical protein